MNKIAVTEKSDTKTRILDAAEAMFSESGFDAVPIREIMKRANAQLGVMTYYFASKEALLDAIVGRRIDVLNGRRRERLAAIAGTNESSIEKLVEILVLPYLELMVEEGPGWRAYARLNAQLAHSRRWAELIHKHFDGVVLLFVAELERLAPHAARAAIIRCMVFALGTMLHVFAGNGRMQSLSGGAVSDDDPIPVAVDLCAFMAGGVRAALGVPAK